MQAYNRFKHMELQNTSHCKQVSIVMFIALIYEEEFTFQCKLQTVLNNVM